MNAARGLSPSVSAVPVAMRYRAEKGGGDASILAGAGLALWACWVGAVVPGYLLGAIMNYAQLVAKEVNRAAAGELDRPWATVAEDVAQIEQAVARAADVSQRLREVGR